MPKTLSANGHSSNTCGEEDGNYMGISASTEGRVMKNLIFVAIFTEYRMIF
jgi:hypothetical protein